MTVIVLPNDRPHNRLGIVASRRVGGAVSRNRAKRLIREVFRLNKDRVIALDIVVIPRIQLLDAPFGAIAADFRDILNRHAKRVRV
jgi:ribonuclease P protein component